MRPISLSTARFGAEWSTPAIIDEVIRLGFTALEWGISPAQLDEAPIAEAVKAGRLAVSSVHAIAGTVSSRQPGLERLDPRGSQISSPDSRLRQASIDGTCYSIELARRLGAGAVVVHAGGIEEGPAHDRFLDFLRRYDKAGGMSDALRDELQSIHADRRRQVQPWFERTVESLREVVRRTGEFPMGIESRYHIYDLPLLEELPAMWRELGCDCFGYWHDFGHVRMQQLFCDTPELRWLELFGHRTLGMHIHDMVGIHDHAPPGEGRLDIRAALAAMATRDYIPVVELKMSHSAEAVIAGREHLERLIDEVEAAADSQGAQE